MSTYQQDGEFRRGAMVAASTDAERASTRLGLLEDLTARRKGETVEGNRPSIARQLNTSVSAVDFIRRKRRKIIPSWLQDRIRVKLIEVLQAELRELEHDRDLYRQVGGDPRADDFCAVVTAIRDARTLLEKAARAS